MAAIPKFNELSPAIQVAIILLVGVGLWALTENVWPLPPLREQVANLQMERDGLEGMAVPLRPFRGEPRSAAGGKRATGIAA